MRSYFNEIYVKNDNNMIYVVSSIEMFDNHKYMIIHLSLVCGWDYINPDYNNQQGYVKASNFICDVQTEMFSFYFLEESLTECLESNGYNIIEKLPFIN